MSKIIDKLIWFFAGILLTHIGYFIYQIRYARLAEEAGMSELIVAVFEDAIALIVLGFDKILPPLVASKEIVVVLVVVMILLIIVLVAFRAFAKIKNDRDYARKIKDAEEILARAEAEAADKMNENKRLKKRLINDFEKKQQALKEGYNEKLAKYKDRIKKLERERLEFKENEATLMSHLRNK